MKTIGILGGMSAASTLTYYRELCSITQKRLGGLNSPELLIRSLNFDTIEKLQFANKWDAAGEILNAEALALERGGADLIVLATNTMHKLADQMMRGVSIPLLHIADATAAAIKAQGFARPGLIATAFTMEQNFYTERLHQASLPPVIPDEADRVKIHRIIYQELCKNIITPESEATYISIAEKLVDRGADCIILGCTEVGMLLNQRNVKVPVFDTTLVHCEAALAAAL